MVVGSRFGDGSADIPANTSVLGPDEIGLGRPTLELGEALSQVPGVFVENRSNFAQDTRLSIRGFGSRAAFGIRGVRVILDGIPLTLPDGQSQVDSLDLANIGRIEVLRGPAGSLYGNAAGGVLRLETKRPGLRPEAETTQTVGAFGLWKATAAGRMRAGETDVSLFVSRTAMNGWREQSSVEQVVAQSRIATTLAPNVRWSAQVHYVRAPVADDPGGLTPDDFRDTPEAAAETNLNFGTGEDLSQLQAGTQLVAVPAPGHRIEVTGHAGMRTFEGRIPFRIVTFDRDFFGGLALYRWAAQAGIVDNQLSAGLEVQGQQDARRNEGNDEGRPDGTVSLAQNERATSLGAFLQDRMRLGERVVLLGSVRYDRVGFRLTDALLANGDVSGQRTFDQLTGQGGVLVSLVDRLDLFANVSQSFETPTFTELVDITSDGGLRDDLDAQRAVSFDGGLRVRAQTYALEASVFDIELRNELIRQEDDEGRQFPIAAGRSRRVGAEAFGRYEPVDGVEFRGSYSWLRATFQDDDRIGVRVPGIPEHRGFARVRVMRNGFHGAVEGEFVGGRFADDANAVRADGFSRLGARIGYTWDPARVAGPEADLTVGIRNVLGVSYVDNVRINAIGERYFEAGLPRHVYGQLTLAWR